MAIEGGMRGKLAVGTRLVARYKSTEHVAEVVVTDGGVRYRLADGRVFKSPSAAGSAVMGGIACNGWRFWSLEAAERQTEVQAAKMGAPTGSQTPHAARPVCVRCGKTFVGAAQFAHHETHADRLCVRA